MAVPALRELFEALSRPLPVPGIAHFSAHTIPGYEAHRIAKDPDSTPCLLLSVTRGVGRTALTPIVMSHLTVQHDLRCRISRPPDQSEEAAFTLIRCLSGDPVLVSKFLDVMEIVVRTVGRAPGSDRVRQTVEELTELFRALDQPPQKTTRGAWSELFLLARARDVGRLAGAWHATPGESFDFSEGSDRVEVKAASGGTREHYFSLVQVHPPRGVRVLVASLQVETLAGGTRIKGLLETLRGRLAAQPALALRVESVSAQILGRSWALALEEAFDSQRAEESLRFFEASAIPSVPRDLPREVTDVRFRSDLSGTASVALGEARQKGGLFEAL